MEKTSTLGVIVANRDFFPDQLVSEARRDLERLLDEQSVRPIWLEPSDTKLGGVETRSDAEKCAALLRRHAEEIDGLLVSLPNFGDEKGVADAIRLAGLSVPVLVQAYPDEIGKMDISRRRDAFCGKISVCDNLRQYGIPFTLTSRHTVHPLDASFRVDLDTFRATCRVVRGLRNLRIGAIGARPAAFNTVRYSERILERHGISVTTIDLSEVLGRAEAVEPSGPRARAKLDELRAYAVTDSVPPEALERQARLGVVLDDLVEEHALDATAIQCWSSLEENWGCCACANMSIMSEKLLPSACEVDVTGALTMVATQLASGTPSAIVDWNNNYGGDEDRCVLFHCGNWARSFLGEAEMISGDILGTILGRESTWGALRGRALSSALTFARISTDDARGRLRAYVGEGELTGDPLETFGNHAVARVPELEKLLRYICENGFEHHVVMNASQTSRPLGEAFENYLGWEVHRHGRTS